MASLNSLYIKKEKLETLLKVLNQKGENGIELTINASDEANQYNQNVSAWVSQTKEQQEAKKNRLYVGNGQTFWTDGKSTQFRGREQQQQTNQPQQSAPSDDAEDSLPF